MVAVVLVVVVAVVVFVDYELNMNIIWEISSVNRSESSHIVPVEFHFL